MLVWVIHILLTDLPTTAPPRGVHVYMCCVLCVCSAPLLLVSDSFSKCPASSWLSVEWKCFGCGSSADHIAACPCWDLARLGWVVMFDALDHFFSPLSVCCLTRTGIPADLRGPAFPQRTGMVNRFVHTGKVHDDTTKHRLPHFHPSLSLRPTVMQGL